MMPDLVLNQRDLIWSKGLWDSIADGGVWAVPRSGLVFRKDADRKRFVLSERMPWSAEMPRTAEELIAYQDDDFETIAARFALIGVAVVKSPTSM
jgi:hypothetical protein